MMRHFLLLTMCLLTVIVSPWAQAVRVHSIYQAEIPVAGQSSETKSKAIPDGLAQVLIKVSGDAHIMNNAALKASLKQADTLVTESSYMTPPGAPKSLPYVLIIRFDPEAINRLLRSIHLPVWGQNRPLISVWFVLDTPTHPADIVDSSTNDIPNLLKQAAKQRGLPFILPMMDVTDINLVSTKDVLNRSVAPLQKAAQRYASNALLIGSVKQTGDHFNSQWQLVLGPDQWNWDVNGSSLQNIFSGIVNDIADALAERYATVMNNAIQSQITLKISGITQQADLMQLMKYLEHLTPVSEVQLVSVESETVILDVSLHGTKQAFLQALSLGKSLQPLPTVSNTQDQEDMLLYRWTP
jgi:hypothetical protein